MSEDNRSFFWPSYVDVMTTLFCIMLVLFVVSYSKFRIEEEKLIRLADKYEEIESIYAAVGNIDSTYFEFDEQYVKHIFKIQVTYQTGQYRLDKLREGTDAQKVHQQLIDAGIEIKNTIRHLQTSINRTDIKYLVVIEGQASQDNYHIDDYRNNDILSYQRALFLHKFWCDNGLDFSEMDRCELVVCGSGEKGVPRDNENEKMNQRFLIHIVPVIGNIKLKDTVPL